MNELLASLLTLRHGNCHWMYAIDSGRNIFKQKEMKALGK